MKKPYPALRKKWPKELMIPIPPPPSNIKTKGQILHYWFQHAVVKLPIFLSEIGLDNISKNTNGLLLLRFMQFASSSVPAFRFGKAVGKPKEWDISKELNLVQRIDQLRQEKNKNVSWVCRHLTKETKEYDLSAAALERRYRAVIQGLGPITKVLLGRLSADIIQK